MAPAAFQYAKIHLAPISQECDASCLATEPLPTPRAHPTDDVSAIIRLIRIHLPWLAVHPRISCSLRHSGASWTVSVLEPRYSFDLSFDSFDLSFNPFHLSFDFFDLSFDICQRIFAMGRTSTRLGANSGRDYQPGPTPGTAVLLVTSCVPSSVKKFTMTWEYAQYNRLVWRLGGPVKHGCSR